MTITDALFYAGVIGCPAFAALIIAISCWLNRSDARDLTEQARVAYRTGLNHTIEYLCEQPEGGEELIVHCETQLLLPTMIAGYRQIA